MTRTLRDFLLILIITVAVGGPLMVWAADQAEAAEGTYEFSDFAIPNPNRGPTVRDLLTIDTSSIAGRTCSVVVDTKNGQSVHPENYITVEGGVPTITVTGSEDGVNGEHQSASTVVMGDSLVIRNHFQLSTSVEGDVTITCTTITSTTVQGSSTTTQPGATTTQPPTSSSTTSSSSSTSTTTPATSTTAPTDSTTTTSPDQTTTTGPGSSTSTTVPPVSTPDPTLPLTGPEDMGGWALGGGALFLLGAALVLGLREVAE